MDFFFCLPILVGCQTKVKPEGDPTPRICPRCHNAAVQSAKSRTWFEFCFVPVVPFKTKHVWICGICQWQLPLQAGGWEPQQAGGHAFFPPPQQGFMGPMSPPGGFQPGYQPGYPPAGPSAHSPAAFDPAHKHN